MLAKSLTIPRGIPFSKMKERSAWAAFRQSLIRLKLAKFQPKVCFNYQDGKYVIKTVQSQAELEEVLALRKKIFIEEGLGLQTFEAFDFDRYDLAADHIILVDTKADKIVGTYRIICSLFSSQFYSQGEFSIDEFLSSPGVKIELGRACIAAEYRNGVTISLIWKGLMRFAGLVGARYMFGCTSLDTTSPQIASGVLSSLIRSGHYGHEYMVHVQPAHYFAARSFDNNKDLPESAIEAAIPSLLRSYLNAGAKVYGLPAFDAEFSCSDLFTVIDLDKIPEKYVKRYAMSSSRREAMT